MAANDTHSELEDVGIAEPVLASDDDSEAVIDAEQLRRHIASSKAARRWKYVRLLLGAISLLVLVGIFVRLSTWKRPFDFISHKQPQFFPEYQSQRVQIRYGPFTVPGNDHNNGMRKFEIRDAKNPCQDCMIVWMQADLEFLEDEHAGAEEGMWLHHAVLHNEANGALHNCDKAKRRQRFFASGNERSVMDLSVNGTEKIGYWFGSGDTISMDTELMNANEGERTVAVTITYEYIPYLPEDFSTATPLWLDIGGCHSEIPVPPNNNKFELGSPVWTSPINGRVVTVVSHLHDGGVNLRLQKDGQDVCVSEAEYGSVSRSEGHHYGKETSHITRMSECYGVGNMSVGEEWTVKARYDLEKHKPMLNGYGEPEPVMGIAMVYVVED